MLGNVKTSVDGSALSGVGWVPIHSVDAGGFDQAGVVLFADSHSVRQQLFDYLDGKTGAVLRYHHKHVLSINAPPGSYTVSVAGTGKGRATLVLVSQKRGGGTATEVFTFPVERGHKGIVRIRGGRISKTMRSGGRLIRGVAGLRLRVRGAPRCAMAAFASSR